jgi:hypothetical protein
MTKIPETQAVRAPASWDGLQKLAFILLLVATPNEPR